MKCIITILMVIVLSMLAACGGGTSTPTTTPPSTQMVGTEVKVDGGSYWIITPAQLYGFKTKDFYLVNLDVTPAMVIQETDLYVKPAEIQENLNKFPTDKSTKIVLYCLTGGSFGPVALALVQSGYTRVMALEGGIIKWQQQGYPAVPYTKTGT